MAGDYNYFDPCLLDWGRRTNGFSTAREISLNGNKTLHGARVCDPQERGCARGLRADRCGLEIWVFLRLTEPRSVLMTL